MVISIVRFTPSLLVSSTRKWRFFCFVFIYVRSPPCHFIIYDSPLHVFGSYLWLLLFSKCVSCNSTQLEDVLWSLFCPLPCSWALLENVRHNGLKSQCQTMGLFRQLMILVQCLIWWIGYFSCVVCRTAEMWCRCIDFMYIHFLFCFCSDWV